MMNMDKYQRGVHRTMVADGSMVDQLTNYALGLAGETGETVDLLKKLIFHDVQPERESVIAELGDVLWYLTALASTLDIGLDEIARANLAKLVIRYPDGFEKGGGIR